MRAQAVSTGEVGVWDSSGGTIPLSSYTTLCSFDSPVQYHFSLLFPYYISDVTEKQSYLLRTPIFFMQPDLKMILFLLHVEKHHINSMYGIFILY